VRTFSVGDLGEVNYERRIAVSTSRLLSVAYFRAQQAVFAGGSEGTLTKWSIKTGACDARFKMPESQENKLVLVWALAMVGDSCLVSGDSLGLVCIWDPAMCLLVQRFFQHQADVLSLASPSSGGAVISGGIDGKISLFTYEDSRARWSYTTGEFSMPHDIRALAVDNSTHPPRYIAGGVSGQIMVRNLKTASGKFFERFSDCFSPFFQRATVAEESRLVLCQCDMHLELWYLPAPKAVPSENVPVTPGVLPLRSEALPEIQQLLKIQLQNAANGDHLTASAIKRDGQYFAASDLSGTRLFRLRLEELEVHCESELPEEVQKTAARVLLFCGRNLLMCAAWRNPLLLAVDVENASVVRRFGEHNVPITHLAASGAWLGSADSSGAVHVHDLDSLTYYVRVPAGNYNGFPTALGFNDRGKILIVVLSDHTVITFDVENQCLVGVQAMQIPRHILRVHFRICGITTLGVDKLMLWGPNFLLAFHLDQWIVGNRDCFHNYQNEHNSVHLLTLEALDEARWGKPILKECRLDYEEVFARSKKRQRCVGPQVMLLALEVTPETVTKSLPKIFERKNYQGHFRTSREQFEARKNN